MSLASDDAPNNTPGGFRITGRRFLAMIVGFFVVVIGVDVTFAVLAYRTHPGEVSVTPYEDGLVYDRKIAQLRAQEALGWAAAAAAEPHAVVVLVHDRGGRPVSGLSLSGKLERPATETGRIVPRFVETGPGRYEARESGLSGAWDLTAEARDASRHTFELERRLTWP
jgi:nitrogen fixation protein FixH